MQRALTILASGLTVAALAVTGAGVANAAAAPPIKTPSMITTPNASDIAFLRSNDQVDLAEIALGTYVIHHAKDPSARDLARVTRRDHTVAEAKVKQLARRLHVTLPATPNAAQQALLAQLKQVKRINFYYFRDQVAGHEQSIAQTKDELRHGRDTAVLAYARYYLPIAQSHLRMSEHDLAYYRAHH